MGKGLSTRQIADRLG
ncbi:hypothetical protein, partial [Verrucomicrobium spinosum]